MPERLGPQPAALYMGSDKLGEPKMTWRVPSRACLEQLLKKVGFQEVEPRGLRAARCARVASTTNSPSCMCTQVGPITRHYGRRALGEAVPSGYGRSPRDRGTL